MLGKQKHGKHRSSRQEMLGKKSILRNFVKFTGKPEAVVRRCPIEKVFLKISQKSQENTCGRASFLIKLHA